MKKSLLRWGTLICILLFSYTGISQIKNTFDVRYENRLKGDITFIANNIVNRETSSESPEDPYNLTGTSSEYNDRLNMQYIDVDGDPSTFSSSSATLAVPDPSCSQIRYAGLYWSAVYTDSDRSDLNQVKFRVPGGSYVDLTADEILFDGYNDGDFGYYAPYACYKDVTSIVTGLTNPEGDYFVGNVRASSGSSIQGGVSGGWTMVVVYENPTYPGKFITTFDGYAGVKSGETVDIPFSGFTTLPPPFPVRAKLGVATLEGDNRITGDQLAFKADSNGSFTTLSNSANPSNNFFNSNITNEGSIVTTRNPNSENTLGWDVDMFTIPNPSNSVIPNDETGATFRASSTQDKYDIFFTSMDVEIIEPKINLAKTVEDIAGNDITGQGVHLGQYLDYVLTFENVGNDDAIGYTIRDVLPINVTLDESSITMPTGTTYTFDPATRTIVFTIPDNYVEEYDGPYSIRMRVQVAENCFDFIDACTDIIENLAYSTYSGEINTAPITDDPSVYDFDGCGFPYPGATNFLLDDLSACNFTRTVQLCGENVLLDAGDNFDNYIWYRDENGNNTIDVGTDTVITDSDSDNDPSTILVDETGTYIVDKQVADPCKDFAEIIVVELFGETQSNPITALINDTSNTIDGDILVCPNDGSELPEIFLCGLNDTELIQINIPDAQSIVWEKLDETSCAEATDGCANTNASCTWNTVDTGNDFLASDSGQYRLVINYQNGCFSRFYFNIYKNPLDPQYTSRDIICNTPGNITVTNMPLSYEYQLVDQATGNVLVPYGPSPSFDITTNGAYMVEMRQEGVTDGCVFVLDNIGILERNFQVDITAQNTSCNDLGAISISVLDVEPQYYYTISQGGVEVDTHGPSTDNNYTFDNLNPGVYDVAVSTDDGCAYTEQVTILDESNLELTARVSQHITCKEGNILMSSTGGKTPHLYAIWSFVDKNGVTQISYPSVADIPASEFQTEQIFDVVGAAGAGTYTYVVVDRNNCYDISNPVTIEFRPAAEYNATSVTDVSCYGESTGTISFNLVDDNGYQLTYYLFDATGFDEENYDFTNALATNSSGNFPGLSSGDYVVVINQRKGSAACDYYEYHSIDAPTTALDLDAVIVQEYSCLQDGIIEAQNVTGGTAPYEYSIDGVTFDSSPTFSNLTDGTYTVTVRDDNGCTFSDSITIAPLDPPTDLVFNSTVPGCPDQTSDVTVSVAGGTAAFVYEIIAPSPIAPNTTSGDTATFNGLNPDTYTFRVTDATGCVYTESYTIAPTTPIGVVGQAVANISCIDAEDGEALFTVSGFNTSYDYTITGPSAYSNTGFAQTDGTISINNLEAGTYNIAVTDNETNCTDTATVTIDAPPSPIDATLTIEQPTCIVDGSVNITATGGWGSYTYEIISGPTGYTPPAPQSNGLFGNLTIGGDYTFKVTDTNGCEFTDIFTINEAVEPVLEIVPNDICYDDATGLTLTANVTDGGDGNFEYSLNGGPFGTNNVFTGLAPGDYTIEVRDGNDCTDTASITIDPELSVVASAPNITACGTDTDVTITAAGGDGNYVYALVAAGATPADTDFAPTNPITGVVAGDYDVYVRDNAGGTDYCEAVYPITIVQDDPLSISVTNTDILCSGESQAQITITASGGETPYTYSIDNGATYQTSNTFYNQPAGSYNIRVRDANNCEITQIYSITEPITLSASAAVTALAECNPGMGAEVRITNAIGGTAPYEYSFDGGSTYDTTSIGYLLPGTHTLYIRDANMCTYPMTVTIDPEPTPPSATATIDYECDGEGTITVTPDSPDFDYTYEIDGIANTPSTSNTFSDVAVGSHTVTVNYISNSAPSPSILLSENFGVGPNTSISEIDPAYCYEPQDGSTSLCGFGTDTHIQDGEYSVTQNIVNPYSSWLSPNDHTGVANGRFLAINVGGVAGVGGIVYQKTGVEVIPNRDITVSLHAFNLLRSGTGGGDPSIEIQLVDAGGNIIASTTTGSVPKNTGANDWHNYSVDLNPGAETNLDIVIRTNSAVINGNDIAIDDIEAYQIPEVCGGSITLDVNVEDGHAFDAAITAHTDITCNGDADGTITFEAENFDSGLGFEYEIDNSGVFTTSTTSPITITGLAAGTHTINIRDLRDPTCSVVLTQDLTQPDVVDVSASVTTELTCTNGGATITATATGGTPAYQYQLEDTSGTPIVTYQSSNSFSGLAAGDYVVRVQDANMCEDVTGTITVVPPADITFDVTPTLCYSGNNDGSIQVDVTSGNGNYQFSINGGAWMTPSTPTDTTYTFENLTAGTYTIDVRDGYGCAEQTTTTIVDALVASVDVVDISTCADGSITVTASGGTPPLEYAFVPTGDNPTGLFSTTNTFTVTAGGDYDVYVRDNSATNPFCEYMETVTVAPATPLTMTATPTDPECHDGTGSILVDIASGIAPYTIEIVDLDNGGASDQTDTNVLASSRTYYNLMPGNYTINVTDASGCTITDTQTINNPDELTGVVDGITPANCTGDPSEFGFEFSGYPTTLGTIEFSDDGGATWIGDNSNPGTSDQFTGYTSGDTVYPSMRTVDGSGNTICQTDLPPFIIPYPLDDLDITILPIVVNCNELQVSVRGQNGTAPYEYAYSDDPANFDPATASWTTPYALGDTHTFVGLVPGRTYTFYVRDDAGCVRQSNVNVNDIITVPLEITSTVTPTCAGLSNGSITYTITDNEAPFENQMRWTVYDMSSGSAVPVDSSGGIVPFSSPQQDVVINNLPAGNYFIEVTEVDSSNNDSCIGATENVLLEELDPLSGTLNVLQDISCNAPGLIEVQNPLGGGGTYTYTVTGPAGFTASTSDNPIEIPANSPAGTYDVSMEDQYGCAIPLGSVNLDLTPNPTIDNIIVENCSDPATVTVLTTSSSGAQIFYSLDGGTTYMDNGGIFNNVAAGTYNVSIIDSNGCTDVGTVTVHPVLQANVSLTKLLDCSPSPDAEITIDVLSGSNDYDYEISSGLGVVVSRTNLPSDPFVFTTDTPEDYTITIYDNNTDSPECSRVFNITVPPAIMPSFNITSFTNVTCNGADDGTISVQAVDNGIGPYTFEIIAASDGSISTPIAPTSSTATTAIFENLPGSVAGIAYDIQVTAANNCADTETVTITEPDPIALTADVVEFVCTTGNNDNNASITVDIASITGGSGNYVRYEFINTDTGTTVQDNNNNVYIETDTAGGNYTINVYDDNGCLGTTTAVIAPYDQITDAVAAITNPLSCTPGMDGQITITVTSTLGDPSRFEYSKDNGANWQDSNVFGGLVAGTYNFLVRHKDTGCMVSTSETITDPNTFDIDLNVVSNVICYGTATGEVTFELVDATYTGGFNWSIFDTNGTPVNTADDIPVTNGISATTGPETYSGLPTGSYRLVISQDAFPECTNEEAFNIAGPNAAITGSAIVTDITCVADGTIEVTATGGWGGYSYYVDTTPNPDPTESSNYVSTPRFENLTAGTYFVWVIDQEGCALQLPDVELSVPDPITATLQVNQSNCVDLQGEIQVVGTTGGQGSNYSYQLIKDGSNFGSPQSSTIFSGLGAGSYTVEITDQWGCSAILPGTVELTNAMTANATVDKTIDCTMNPGGKITINVTGGSSNLEYTATHSVLGFMATNNDGIFTNLTDPGEYIFTVTDLDTSEPCTYEVRQTLDDKVDPILEDATIIDVSCAGGSDGSILAQLDSATALNPPYQYELIGLSPGAPSRPLQDEPLFDNLPEGTYQVRVVSERECEAVKTETVGEPDPLGASATATTFECTPSNSVVESTITVTPSGGTPFTGPNPYLYSFEGNGFTSDNTFDVVDDGTVQPITYIVRDANGCEYPGTINVQPLNTFTLDIAQDVAITCNNPERVLLTVNENIGGDTYTIELLPVGNPYGSMTASTTTTATFELTQAGTYTFRATNNATGCFEEVTYTIDPYDTIDVDATATSPAVCFDDAGELTIDVTGYTGAYNYEVFRNDGTLIVSGNANTSTGSLAITHPDLLGGNYYVEVEATEAPYCDARSGSVTIISPSSELAVVPEQVASVTCTDNMGEVLIAPTGGYAPYDIVLTNITTTQSYTMNDIHSYVFTGLSAGSYEVRVTDSEGCEIIDNTSLTLDPVDPITADIDAAPIDLLCFGDESASVWAYNVAGGEGSYNYLLNYYDETGTNIVFTSGEQGSPRFNNLGAGTYSITITDGWNCSFTTDTVTIEEPSEVEAILRPLAEMTCETDGSLRLSATGGTGSYQFFDETINDWVDFDNGDYHEFYDLPEDDYQFLVRDANECTAIISNQVGLQEPPELMLEIDESAAVINCMGEASATIIAQATGGLGNYRYELFADAALTNLVDGPQTNGTFNELTAGEYYVRVTSEDCVEVSSVITIVDPAPLQIDREEFTNITCSGINDGTITVEVSGGTGEIQYAISPNLDQFDTTNTFTDLEPGIYDVIAQDANGCFITFQFEITQPEPVVAEAINIMDEVCFESGDGSFEIQISGGTAPYQTSLNSSADANFVQDQVLFQDLPAGTHVVFVRDAQGCETNIIVEIDPGVNLAATVTPVYECTENIPDNYLDIVLEDESIAGDLMYALDSTDPADMQLSADFTNMTPGDHYLTIAHANGCMTTYDFTIEAFEPLTLTLENSTINQITAIAEGGVEDYTFYFNGIDNGTDNTFYINRTDTYTVTVVDQNGCEATAEIFMEFIDIEFPNFFTPDGDGRNDIWIPDNLEGFPDVLIKIYDRYGRVVEEMTRNVKGWDGNYDGKPLPTGDYWYVVKLEGEQDFREFVGHFTLYRE